MIRAVLFDWDGTLVDTAEVTYRCYVRMFTEIGIAFDRPTFARTYSPNWYHTFRALGMPEEQWEMADARWLELFCEERVELIDGARELLEALASRGLVTGVVTSGSRPRITREAVEHGLARHIAQFVCGTDVKEKKPHPEGLLLCLERMNIRPAEAVYVGDSPEDVGMARAAGVYSVAVCGGYPNREALIRSGPDAFSESIRDVVELLDAR